MDLAFAQRLVSRVILASRRATHQRKLARIPGWRLLIPIGAALLAIGGCAAAQVPPPSEEVRARLGRIGVVAGTSLPSGEWHLPAKGGAAGAGRGAALGAVAGGSNAGILAPFAAAAGAIVGAIAGGATAESTERVETAEAVIQAAFADLQMPTALRDRVLDVARSETRRTLVVLEGGGVIAPGDARAEPPAEAVGTVLQLRLQGYGTKAVWLPNPLVFLFLNAQVSLRRAADGVVLHTRTATWMSAGRPLTAWAVADGEPVRQELARGIQYLAERIVDVLFLLRPFP